MGFSVVKTHSATDLKTFNIQKFAYAQVDGTGNIKYKYSIVKNM